MSLFDSLKFSRLIRLSFYTTSVEKLLQARIIFSRRGYNLGFSRINREPYEEDYSSSTSFLLKEAIKFIEDQSFIRGAYFIEDTSLRLEALSSEADVPGMRVKEWFSATTFAELDQQLASAGGERTATIKSDIALKLPTLSEPILFHGETRGIVADTPPSFAPSAMYPWLTPHTFNGWFVPDDQNSTPKRLGEMEFEESLQYDFRAKSLSALLDQYDRLNAAANIGGGFVSVRPDFRREARQLEFDLSQRPPIICVIGYKCSGKTTFAHIGQGTREIIHLEASDFFRNCAAERGIIISSDDEALLFMESYGHDVVARSMVEHLDKLSENFVIITGLRTPEELSLLRLMYPSLVVVGITSDDRTRYERHVRRGRELHIDSYKKFSLIDDVHSKFGLVTVMPEVCDVIISNNGSLEDYKRQVTTFLASLGATEATSHTRTSSELARSLIALASFSRAATCDEIADCTGDVPVRRYNVNRALKSVPVFAERVERPGQLLSYRPTPRLAAIVDLITKRASA